MWFVYVLLGMISVVAAVLILRHELKKAIYSIPKMPSGESFRKELDEVNSSFFEIANDLEGKYSVHEKQIQDLEGKVRKLLSDQARLMNNSLPASSAPICENTPRRRSTDQEISELRAHNDKQQQGSIRLERTRQSDYALAREAKAMLDQGMPLPEVAKQMGIGIGELKLILGVNIVR